jgi:hypothetical protein
LTYPPERAAAEILTAVQRRRPRVLITQTAHLMDVMARLAPARASNGPRAHIWAGPPPTRPEPHRSQYRTLTGGQFSAAVDKFLRTPRHGRGGGVPPRLEARRPPAVPTLASPTEIR